MRKGLGCQAEVLNFIQKVTGAMEGVEQGTNMTHNQVCALEMNNNNNCIY